MAGQIYERLHTRDMSLMGGMWGQFRYLAPFLVFFCAALLGIPGTGNFVGEILIVLGSFQEFPITTTIVTVSFVWAGLYSLILVYKALFGENTTPALHKAYAESELAKTRTNPSKPLTDLNKRELSLLSVLAIGLLWVGLFPQAVLNTSNSSMQFVADNHRTGELPLDYLIYTPKRLAYERSKYPTAESDKELVIESIKDVSQDNGIEVGGDK